MASEGTIRGRWEKSKIQRCSRRWIEKLEAYPTRAQNEDKRGERQRKTYFTWASDGTSISKTGFFEYRVDVGPPAAFDPFLQVIIRKTLGNRSQNIPAASSKLCIHPSAFLRDHLDIKGLRTFDA
jgi:hypothetical protein